MCVTKKLINGHLLIQAPARRVYNYYCEPEIAADSCEVARRIRSTVFTLGETFARVIHWNQELPGQPATAPVPVIQGWRPEDYRTCAKLMEDHVISDPAAAQILGSNEWPATVGVGSVCRRNLTGPNNLYKVVDALEDVLPSHVRLHLFGVKSTAVANSKIGRELPALILWLGIMPPGERLLRTASPKRKNCCAIK